MSGEGSHMKEKNLDALIEGGIAEFHIETNIEDSVMEKIKEYESSPRFSRFRMLLYPVLILISIVSIWIIEKFFVLVRPNLEQLNVNILFAKFSIHGTFISIILVMIYMTVSQVKSFRGRAQYHLSN